MDLFGRQVYHRKQSPTQTPEVARMQEESGEIWGMYNRDAMDGRRPYASVDAYPGPLPSGQRESSLRPTYHRIATARRTSHAGQGRATA